MELTIDFRFRLLEREDFIALSQGEAVANAIADRGDCQSVCGDLLSASLQRSVEPERNNDGAVFKGL
jgi:hypothetical protein